MDNPLFLKKIVDWLRAGYPDGVPQADYIPLVALLRRQLSNDELQAVSDELIAESAPPPEPISKIDAGVKITKVTQELPHDDDVARVRRHLEAQGWPFDDRPLEPHDSKPLAPEPDDPQADHAADPDDQVGPN